MENILLVFGGRSYEHDISIVTASQVFNKTKLDDYNLIPLYVSKDNKFFVYNSKRFDLKDFSNSDVKNNKKFKEIVFVSGEYNKLFLKGMFGLKEYLSVNYALIACHGGIGENGELVSFLKQFKIYSSCGSVEALSVCMNKFVFKQVAKGLRIPTVRGFKVTEKRYKLDSERIEFNLNIIGFPVIIKVNSGGSSIGVFVAKNKDEFDLKIQDAFEFDSEVLVEKYIADTREFNIAIVGTSEKYEVSEIDEPLKEDEVLTFADKYLSGSAEKGVKVEGNKNSMATQIRKIPADISVELERKIRFYASKIFESLNFSGVVRIDFLFDEKNNKCYVCEVNSIPGSLAFYFFKENRITINNLVLKLIDIARVNEEKDGLFNPDFMTEILN